MEIPTQIIPPAVIDRGHQATQQLNSNHTLRLLALIDTYRGPTRIQTSLVVPDQSDKPVPDQIDILKREGITLAKQRGAYRGRTPSLDADKAAELREKAAAGVPKAALARQYGISRETVYAYLRADT